MIKTVDLIKAWANWARGKPVRHTCGSAERRYRAPSDIDARTHIPSGITIRDIYACDDAWRQLPIRFRRLIQCIYITGLPDNRTAKRTGIPLPMIKICHDKAVRMLSDNVQTMKNNDVTVTNVGNIKALTEVKIDDGNSLAKGCQADT